MSKSSKRILALTEGYNWRKFALIASGLIGIGVGIVLLSRASIPIYTSDWGYWGPRIRGCESGSGVKGAGIYTAQNRISTASGAYQFLDSTWANYKGYEKARLAPPEVQEEKAYQTFAASGTSPWNASYLCWGTGPGPDQYKIYPTEIHLQGRVTDLEPLIPGNQDLSSEAKTVKYVSTPPADGLDPYVASPIVQILRFLGFLRA